MLFLTKNIQAKLFCTLVYLFLLQRFTNFYHLLLTLECLRNVCYFDCESDLSGFVILMVEYSTARLSSHMTSLRTRKFVQLIRLK